MPHLLNRLVLGCLLSGLAALRVHAAEITADEYAVKADLLLKLGSFISWPQTVFDGPDAPFHICVLGRDPFGEKLDARVVGQTISGHPVALRRLDTVFQSQDCEVLFVSDSEPVRRLQSVFQALDGKPVLTAGDIQDFVTSGGMVQFFSRDDKIRLMLDPQTIEEAGLKLCENIMDISISAQKKEQNQ